MTVENYYAIAIDTLGDWFKKSCASLSTNEKKNQSQSGLARVVYPALKQATRDYYKFGVVHCAVFTCCDWSNEQLCFAPAISTELSS